MKSGTNRVMVIIITAIIVSTRFSYVYNAFSEVSVGDTAPNFVATDIHGKKIELPGHKLRRERISEEERAKTLDFYQRYKERGLEIIRVAYKGGIPFFISKSFVEDRAKRSLAKRKETWTAIIDWKCRIKELYRIKDTPLLLAIDKAGIVRLTRNEDFHVDEELENTVIQLLEE